MLRTISAILWKDLKIEFRTKEAISASFVFATLVLVIFNFTLDLATEEARRLASGFFWVAFAFGGILSLNRSFAIEREEGAMRALVASPADRGGIYVGKFLANLLFMLLTQLLILPLFTIFFDVAVGSALPRILLIFFLGSVGFSAVGTVFAAVAANTRMRELLLPVLMLPISIPLLIAAVETTAGALGSGEDVSGWMRTLVIYDVVFVIVCFLVFEYALEE